MQATQEKKTIIKAINELGRRVTAADVATKTGMPILKATSELNRIAEETQGHMEVATTGDVAYKFPLGFESAYLAKGLQRVLQQFGQKAFEVGFFLLRISFGIMLIVSFIMVIGMIIAVYIAMQKGNDRDGDRGGFNFHFGFFDYLVLRDLIYWTAYSASNQPTHGGYAGRTYDIIDHNKPTTRMRPRSNFLFDCFSFLFGDGNPNTNLDERKWQLLAQVIKRNGGVVTAEQLAPYTGADPNNEDGVLPVLVRFDGRPEVTEQGDIFYIFPSLQVTAADQVKTSMPSFLREFPWQFVGPSTGSLVPVFILAGVNFLGGFWLLAQIDRGFILHALTPVVYAVVVYATLFIIVPLVRFLVQQFLNGRIEERNRKRKAYYEMISNPTPEVERKLISAEGMRMKEHKVKADDVIFTTERDSLEQEFDASP